MRRIVIVKSRNANFISGGEIYNRPTSSKNDVAFIWNKGLFIPKSRKKSKRLLYKWAITKQESQGI